MVGVAVTVAPVVALNVPAGLQLYVPAPLAVITKLLPWQMVVELGVTLKEVGLTTFTVAVFVVVQP